MLRAKTKEGAPRLSYVPSLATAPCQTTVLSGDEQDSGSRNTRSIPTYCWKIVFFIEFKNQAGRCKICPSSSLGSVFVQKGANMSMHSCLEKKQRTSYQFSIAIDDLLCWDWHGADCFVAQLFYERCLLWTIFACLWIKRSVVACSAVYVPTRAR